MKFFTLVLCLLAVLVRDVSKSNANEIPNDLPEDYVYLHPFRSSYNVYRMGLDYEDMVLRCQVDGAAMFHPRSRQETDAVFSLLLNDTDRPIFIGIHDWMGTGNFTTVDGEPAFNVSLESPSASDRTFAAMYGNGSVVKLEGRDYKYPTVCRIMHSRPCRAKNITDIETEGYAPLRNSSASYKYYDLLHYGIYTSNLRCLTDAAHQFHPDSRRESEEIFRSVVPKGVSSIRLGIHDYFRLDSLKTVEGRDDFYSNWLPGHPDNSTVYVLMRNDTTFASDTLTVGFVCKRRTVDCREDVEIH